MQTLESLRGKIDTASDLRSVVKTMKTLAAVSIRQYERAVEALTDYSRTVELGFQIALRGQPIRIEKRETRRRTGAIVFGTDQGMCGQFNERIASAVPAVQDVDCGSWKLVAVGARVEGHLQDAGHSLEQTYPIPTSVSEITDLVQELLLRVERWQEESDVSRLLVFFNTRTSGASYQPQQLQLLPIDRERFRRWSQQPWQSCSLPMFTMERRRLLSCIVRQYLFVSLFRACAESLSSENASRITAMQAAEKSIEQRLDDLRSSFNQLRQSAITEELLDVVSGFEALSKQRSRKSSK